MMDDEHRQRMNLRTIRVTLTSALRHVDRERTQLCLDRARQLLDHAREEASSPAIVSEIDELEATLENGYGELQKES